MDPLSLEREGNGVTGSFDNAYRGACLPEVHLHNVDIAIVIQFGIVL